MQAVGTSTTSHFGNDNQGFQAGVVNGPVTLNQVPETIYKNIVKWLSPTDPWTNHSTARRQHQLGTGEWLLQSEQYKRWLNGEASHLWLSGKPGSGKTVLCSTVVEELRSLKEQETEALAVYYFSFSDSEKRSYANLMRSLVVQLGDVEPARSMLKEAFEKPVQVPSTEWLEEVLMTALDAYTRVWVVVDALDECLEESRDEMLVAVQRLASKVRLFVTSRNVNDIRLAMQAATPIEAGKASTDYDIRKYLEGQLQKGRLARFSDELKAEIEKAISEQSDGMFRWAHLQLEEIKALKVLRPSFIRKALKSLPNTLDETYDRMLRAIEAPYRWHAVVLLRWLTYAMQPLTLAELVEVVLINDGVDFDDRGDLEDALNILGGLVVVSEEGRIPHARVRLAHFSVKEYLESERCGKWRMIAKKAHHFILQGCATYIMHCKDVGPTVHSLLLYACYHWANHAALHDGDVGAELRLLKDPDTWLRVFQPDRIRGKPWRALMRDRGGGLYYAAFLGLDRVVGLLGDVNVRGGQLGTPLQAACLKGHVRIVSQLLDAGADLEATGGTYGSALHAAARAGRVGVVQLLLERGADVHKSDGNPVKTVLQSAVAGGSKEVVQMLLDRKVAVTATSDDVEIKEMLQKGREDILRSAIQDGDVEKVRSFAAKKWSLAVAVRLGNVEMVKALLQAGAVDEEAILIAVEKNKLVLVTLLFDGDTVGALRLATRLGRLKIIGYLLSRGVKPDAEMVKRAVRRGNVKTLELFLQSGARVNVSGIEVEYNRDKVEELLRRYR